MSLRFVLGPAGAGKTKYLFDTVIKEAKAHPEVMYYYLVPEQFSLQTQYDLLSVHPDTGIINIDVTSMARLANGAFAKLSGMKAEFIPEIAKSMIIKKVLIDHRDELQMYRSISGYSGFVAEAKALLSELWQYSVTEEDLLSLIDKADKEPVLKKKLSDALTIYRGFSEYTDRGLLTNENMYDAFAEILEKSGILKNAVIILDGFTGFTPSQNSLLRKFLKLAKDVYVSFTIDEWAAKKPADQVKVFDRSYMSRDAMRKMEDLAREAGVDVEAYSFVHHKKYANNALTNLENKLFRGASEQVSCENAVSIYNAASVEEECKYVATCIEKLIRQEGLRYKDIAVVCADPEGYNETISNELARVGVRFFCDRSKSLYENECSGLLSTILRIMEKAADTDLLINYAKNSFSGISFEDACLLENYCIALGIRGNRFKTPFTKEAYGYQELDLDHINAVRKQLMHEVGRFIKLKKQKVKDLSALLFEFLTETEIEKKLNDLSAELMEKGEVLKAKEYGAVFKEIVSILDQLVQFLGEEEMGAREFREIMEAGLSEASVGLVPHGFEQIIIGDVERTRLSGVKALFVMGANDGKLPKAGSGKGIISDKDKENLRAKGVELSPSHLRKVGKDRFYLYLAFTKPVEKLFITYSAAKDGESMKSAPVLQDIKNIYSDLKEITRDQLDPVVQVLWNDKGHNTSLAEMRVKNTEEIENREYVKEQISEATAKLLYGERITGSITRLETFASCPFRHFMNFGLRVGEREEYTLSPIDFGDVAHTALENYGKLLKEQNKKWQLVEAEERHSLILQCAEKAISEYKEGVFSDSEKNLYISERIAEALDVTVEKLTKHLQVGDFEPAEYEQTIAIDKPDYFFKGKIDRVDICKNDTTKAVKIIDYKTSDHTFDITKLYYGLSLQLPTYLKKELDYLNGPLAEKEAEQVADKIRRIMSRKGDYRPAAMLYNVIKDPISGEDADQMAEYAEDDNSIYEDEGGKAASDGKLLPDALDKAFKPKGLVNKSTDMVSILDRGFATATGDLATGHKSMAIPVATSAKGGFDARYSKVVSEQDMQLLLEYTEQKIENQVKKIKTGNTAATPCVKNNENISCKYCPYSPVCGHDMQNGGRQRNLKTYKEEEIWKKMKEGANLNESDD